MKNPAGKISLCLAWIMASMLGVASIPALAHGGISLEKDVCKLTLGTYSMHFTGYQPSKSGNAEFCEDIPSTGQTIFVLDAIDDALREMPIEVKIVPDSSENAGGDQTAVLHIVPRIYKTGSVSFEYNFDRAGKYVGIVTAGNSGEIVSRFPFSVAAKKSQYGIYVAIFGVLLIGSLLYFYAGHARGRSKSKPLAARNETL
jgi:hypothetical protein